MTKLQISNVKFRDVNEMLRSETEIMRPRPECDRQTDKQMDILCHRISPLHYIALQCRWQTLSKKIHPVTLYKLRFDNFSFIKRIL